MLLKHEGGWRLKSELGYECLGLQYVKRLEGEGSLFDVLKAAKDDPIAKKIVQESQNNMGSKAYCTTFKDYNGKVWRFGVYEQMIQGNNPSGLSMNSYRGFIIGDKFYHVDGDKLQDYFNHKITQAFMEISCGSRYYINVPEPFFELPAGSLKYLFPDPNHEIHAEYKKVRDAQSVLVHDYRRRCANMATLSIFLYSMLSQKLIEAELMSPIVEYALLCGAAITAVAFVQILQQTRVGDLEWHYNKETTKIRDSLDQFLGKTISSCIPHLDTVARFACAYAATYIVFGEDLLIAIPTLCAILPYLDKIYHDAEYANNL